MQYAIVDNRKSEAAKGLEGTCPICKSTVIAKCGPRVIHHWAHTVDRTCDPWWENETAWHRQWKNLFPEDCREITHTASDGEIHRADIKTPTGIVIEVQHSSMSDKERLSRESFYRNLVWIVDGTPFSESFETYHFLPDPKSDLAADLIWTKTRRDAPGTHKGLFFRRSDGGTYQVHGMDEVKEMVEASYVGHMQYDWVRPRQIWLDATCPVYIDFGDEFLVRLEIYGESDLRCIRMIAKEKFLHDAMTESAATAIATRFYPINS